MVAFEVSVNGERRFVGDAVTAITLVSELAGRRQADRVSMHIGTGGPGELEIHHLAADLRSGDEITIRVLDGEAILKSAFPGPDACSFCGSGIGSVKSLVAGGQVAVCDACVAAFSDVVVNHATLPVGASIRQTPDGTTCGFCEKTLPDVPALLVRNGAAICPECLRSCADLRGSDADE